MPDNVLSFETRVNLSGLESGTAQAKSTISQFSATAKQAMETAAQATANLASAQRELASVVAAGGVEGAKAAAVIAEYAQEARQAQAAASDYAKENITAASAVRTLSSAEAEETGVLQRSMSTRMAASTELRELSGNLTGSTRAAGAFLASLPGIGAAMQAAFPIFGAVAVLEILGQLAGKVHAVYDEWVNLRSIQNDVIKSVLEDEEQEIRLSEQRVAQLREERGLQAELRGDKAGRSDRGAAAKARFDVNIDQNSLELAKANLAAVNQQLDQLRAKSKETTDTPIMGELGSAKTLTDDARRAAAEIPKLTEKMQSYGDEITTLSQKLQVAHDQETLRNKESGEREAVAGAEAIKKANASLYESMENDYNRSRAAGNATLASEYEFWSARLQLFDSSTEQYKAIFEKVANIAEANARRVHTAIELLKAGDSVSASDTLTGAKKPNDQGETEARLAMMKEFSLWTKQEGEDLAHTGERWKEYNAEVAKGAEQAAQTAAAERLASLAQQEALGNVKAKAGAYQKAAIEAADYTAKLKALDEELRKIAADQSLTPEQKATQSLGVQNQISQVQGQQSVAGTQSTTAITNAIAAPYLKAFDTINNAWLKVQNDIIAGNRNIARDFVQMGVSLVQAGAQAAEKWLAQMAITWIKNEALHLAMTTKVGVQDTTAAAAQAAKQATANSLQLTQATTLQTALTALVTSGQATQTAAVVAGQAAQTAAITAAIAAQTAAISVGTAAVHAIEGTSNVAEVTADAAVAAAGTMAYWSAINPPIAPAMAAAAFAETEAYAGLAAFEAGGIVSGGNGLPVPIMAHAGERVLSAPQTQNFERMVNGGGGSSHTTHINYSPHVSAFDNSGLKSTLHSHRDTILDIVRQGYKQGSLVR